MQGKTPWHTETRSISTPSSCRRGASPPTPPVHFPHFCPTFPSLAPLPLALALVVPFLGHSQNYKTPLRRSTCQFPVHCRRIHLNGKSVTFFVPLRNCFAEFTCDCDLHSAGQNEKANHVVVVLVVAERFILRPLLHSDISSKEQQPFFLFIMEGRKWCGGPSRAMTFPCHSLRSQSMVKESIASSA